MWKIIKLDKNLSNQISAWEVVERPLSVVKELVENSIDSKADYIKVSIKNWWIDEIIVSDNWEWISKEDLPLTIEKYTTSKIKSLEDLYNVMTFWFRWEALSSISSVSDFEIISKFNWEEKSYSLYDWKIKDSVIDSWTKIIVKNLFHNTPARLNYLKKPRTEYNHIYTFLNNIALSYPNIWFEFESDWKKIFNYNLKEKLENRIYNIYWEDFYNNLLEINFKTVWINISWFICDPKISFPNKNRQSIFVNHRVINSPLITRAIIDSYNRFIPHNNFSAYVLFLDIDPTQVDVNVHPRKQEIRFANEQEIFRSFYNVIESKLKNVSLIDNDFSYTQEKTDNNNLNTNREFNKEKFYTWSWTKFKEYSPYKDIKINPEQSNIWNAINFTKQLLWNNFDLKEDFNSFKEENIQKSLNDTKIWKIVGQVFNSYIIVETKDKIKILDQHALAERIIFEKLKSQTYIPKTQWLLISESLNLTRNEVEILQEYKDIIKNIWFEFEFLSSWIVILNWIPDFIKKENIKDIFLWVLDDISNWNLISKKLEEVRNKIFAYTSCRSAVKFWNKLNLFEINKLLNDSVLDYSSTCPHWRPVIFDIDLHDLKNKFER